MWIDAPFCLCFPLSFVHLALLAVQLANQTCFFFFLFDSTNYIEKHRADDPSEIQWPPKGKPTNPRRSIQSAFLHVFDFSDLSNIIYNKC